jgi:hypothetical protein
LRVPVMGDSAGLALLPPPEGVFVFEEPHADATRARGTMAATKLLRKARINPLFRFCMDANKSLHC